MIYHSTSNHSVTATISEAILHGYAPDGGQYLPEKIPTLPRAFMRNLSGMTLQEVSYAIANYALQGDIDAQVLHDVVNETLNFPIPLIDMGEGRHVLELFHGPSMSFKDIGARFMARLLAHYYASKGGREINVLIATSGHSGGAIANGFYGIEGINVYILYPQDQLSSLQRAQFATLGKNITAIEVNGTLGDCKNMVYEAFNDPDLSKRMLLTSAKSVNIARLLPQMFYYFWAYGQLQKLHGTTPEMVVAAPCGNLGNLTAGVMARQMGLPIKRLIAADNKNDVFTTYLRTGKFVPRATEPSLAIAMDCGNPRNFPRLQRLLGDHAAMCQIMEGFAYSDERIISTIASTWHREQYLLNPHSATAYQALLDGLRPGETGVALATSHPAKAQLTVESAIGATVDTPEALMRFFNGFGHITTINSGYTSLKKFLLSR
ncbi:MAG: threonine synthase [Bacteroidales bacterium]|nr:threonine synthase [Bacteroidales bacterium]